MAAEVTAVVPAHLGGSSGRQPKEATTDGQGGYEKGLPRDWFTETVQSWDTATETGEQASYSVCTTWSFRENRYYLLNVLRERLDFPDLQKKVIQHARTWDASPILIEKAGSGHALLQTLDRETNLSLIPVPPRFDKETRVGQVSTDIESGRVFLPHEAPWLADFEREIFAFPYGKHDDQVDSMTHFLWWAANRNPKPRKIRAIPLGVSGGIRDRYFERTGRRMF